MSQRMGRLAEQARGEDSGESAILGGESLVVLVDQFAVAFRGVSGVGEAELILADEGLESFGQLDFDRPQGSDHLFAQEVGGGRIVPEGAVGGLAQPLEGPVERAAQFPVARKGAAELFGVAEELAEIGASLSAVGAADGAATGAGLGVLRRPGLTAIGGRA